MAHCWGFLRTWVLIWLRWCDCERRMPSGEVTVIKCEGHYDEYLEAGSLSQHSVSSFFQICLFAYVNAFFFTIANLMHILPGVYHLCLNTRAGMLGHAFILRYLYYPHQATFLYAFQQDSIKSTSLKKRSSMTRYRSHWWFMESILFLYKDTAFPF